MSTTAKTAAPETFDRVLIGEFRRFSLEAFRTRFGTVTFFVLDAETPDPLTGTPSIVRQGDNAQALALPFMRNNDVTRVSDFLLRVAARKF